MLKQLFFLQYGYGAQFELQQSLCEGKDVEKYRELAQKIDAIPMEDGTRNRLTYAFWDQLAVIPASCDIEKNEPSDYEGILKLRKNNKKMSVGTLSEEELFDKVYGAWLGRVIGCMFGKPVEGLKKNRIEDILKKLNNYPMRDYIVTEKYKAFCERECVNFDALVENYGYAPADDDTNYTVIGLTVLEKYGKNFTTEDIAEEWIKGLPAMACCTAEFCAYRNILNKVFPPLSATYRNPFREWIGAQIRG
ncbi:MAG: ADP-ribosylglycohydrolase family protein, partial [Candidatus Scatosoma sp.]